MRLSVSEPRQTDTVYTGPTVDNRSELADGLAAYKERLGRFYTEAGHRLDQQAAAARAVQAKRVSAPRAPVVLDGDRFDRLSSCEAGQDPTNLSPGGKYRGAFQFSLPTWHAAGMSGDPIDYTYADQKKAAMSWATQADPAGQWPVCWPRSA